ncbi:hypothetical protein RQP46_005478 [Phenoliferia psychrophenolica]
MQSSSSPFAAFSSPLGPIHLAPPSVSSSLLAFFRPTPKTSASNSSSSGSSKASTSSLAPLDFFITKKQKSKSTYSPSTGHASLPPTYQEAVGLEEDLEFEDRIASDFPVEKAEMASRRQMAKVQAVETERERLIRQDREMGAQLALLGM